MYDTVRCMRYELVQLTTFTTKAQRIGLTDEDMRNIELEILADAEGWPVMKGTGGLRKMRFAPEKSSVLEEVTFVYFITVFAKNEQDNLSKGEQEAVRKLIERLKATHLRTVTGVCLMAKNAKAEKRTAAGREIIAALTDLVEMREAGIPLAEKYRVKTVEIKEPGKYGAKQVRALREKLGVSQAVFAELIGASTVLVQKWEQGKRNPDGMARRLMDGISANPELWLQMLGLEAHAVTASSNREMAHT